jgi:branched-chain amino acid transport system ATP-binding protein
MSFLVVEGLQKSFGGVRAVAGVSFELARGEILALIGPNGAGKSTCFNMLYGLITPDAGTVRLDGRDITAMRPRDIWRLGVGRTFQITATFASMTVVENVQMALISHAGMSFSVRARARTMARGRALELLDLAGMADQADRAASVLAYGDLKRLELAIALAHEPGLLLMDEPTAGMAPAERGALMELVGAIVRERHMATLFTEHDMDIVFGHADRVLVLNRGELIAEGSPDRIRADPRVIEVYLGGGHA